MLEAFEAASMRPRSFERGKADYVSRVGVASSGFNEAALFRTRKDSITVVAMFTAPRLQ